MKQVPNLKKEKGEETRRTKISALIALTVIGLMFTATAVSAASTSANTSNIILTNLIGSMSAATSSTNSKSVNAAGTSIVTSIPGWTLVANGTGFGDYPNLRQYNWTTIRPPYGQYDE